METIGDRIKTFASKTAGSQTALAESLQLSVQTLSGYSNNRSFPDAQFFTKLSALGCNIDWLLTGRGKMIVQLEETTFGISLPIPPNAKNIRIIFEE